MIVLYLYVALSVWVVIVCWLDGYKNERGEQVRSKSKEEG